MHWIDSLFSALAAAVAPLLSAGPLRSLLVDGVIGGVGSVLVFLPQIVILFVFVEGHSNSTLSSINLSDS